MDVHTLLTWDPAHIGKPHGSFHPSPKSFPLAGSILHRIHQCHKTREVKLSTAQKYATEIRMLIILR